MCVDLHRVDISCTYVHTYVRTYVCGSAQGGHYVYIIMCTYGCVYGMVS